MTVRVVVEIIYDIKELGLKGIREDLQDIISGGTRHGRVHKIYLEAKPSGIVYKAEDFKKPVHVILYNSHDGGFQ